VFVTDSIGQISTNACCNKFEVVSSAIRELGSYPSGDPCNLLQLCFVKIKSSISGQQKPTRGSLLPPGRSIQRKRQSKIKDSALPGQG
jgi:hypothetical protein